MRIPEVEGSWFAGAGPGSEGLPVSFKADLNSSIFSGIISVPLKNLPVEMFDFHCP
jgi:hypothetical protein